MPAGWHGAVMRGSIFPLLLALSLPATASEDCTEDAMIVFDGSGSMAETGFNQLDEPRIFGARRAVAEVIPEIAARRDLGLIVYGPNGADTCAGLDLRFRPMANAAPRIISDVNRVTPDGDTALTEAVRIAAEVLEHDKRPGTILLVTDGKETCGGMPCALAGDLLAESVDLTIHVIGFQVRGEFFAWGSQGASDYNQAEAVSRCLADRTGGIYVRAETVDELIDGFRKTLGCRILF